MNVYPFIEAEQAGKHNVKRACELLKISRSAYYQHARGEQSTRARVDEELTGKIRAVHAASNGTYGAPRIHAELAGAGLRHGRKRIARLMRGEGVRGKSPRRWQASTIPGPAAPTRPDLVQRDFAVNPVAIDTRSATSPTSTPGRAGCIWPPSSTWRRGGRSAGPSATTSRPILVDAALTDALRRRRPADGLVCHSDRGCQYTSAQHARLAKRHGVRLSVGRRGQCWDNAVAESFFAALKTELIHRQAWTTRQAAYQTFEYIEGRYNTRRWHSSLGYQSPVAYEAGTSLTPLPALRVA